MKKILGLIVFVGIILIIGLGALFIDTYNSLQAKDEDVNAKWAMVEIQLKQRNDLIPNILNTVKGYATHEEDIFTYVANTHAQFGKAVSAKNIIEINKSAKNLSNGLTRLGSLVEKYPELKSNSSFLALQKELSETEDKIAKSRKEYNESVKELNTQIRTYPTAVVAAISGIKSREYLSVSEEEQEVPVVKF